MKEITVQDLKKMKDAGEDFQLIDVREQLEVEVGQIGGQHIPMGDILARINEIDKNKKVVIHCRSGARSAAVCNFLETQQGFNNVYNLKGGITAWSKEIDPTVQVG